MIHTEGELHPRPLRQPETGKAPDDKDLQTGSNQVEIPYLGATR